MEIIAEDDKFKALFYQDTEMHLLYHAGISGANYG